MSKHTCPGLRVWDLQLLELLGFTLATACFAGSGLILIPESRLVSQCCSSESQAWKHGFWCEVLNKLFSEHVGFMCFSNNRFCKPDISPQSLDRNKAGPLSAGTRGECPLAPLRTSCFNAATETLKLMEFVSLRILPCPKPQPHSEPQSLFLLLNAPQTNWVEGASSLVAFGLPSVYLPETGHRTSFNVSFGLWVFGPCCLVRPSSCSRVRSSACVCVCISLSLSLSLSLYLDVLLF